MNLLNKCYELFFKFHDNFNPVREILENTMSDFYLNKESYLF